MRFAEKIWLPFMLHFVFVHFALCLTLTPPLRAKRLPCPQVISRLWNLWYIQTEE